MESSQRLANSFYRGIFPALLLLTAIGLSACSGSKTQVAPPPIETTPAAISPTAEPATQEPTNTPAPTSTPVPTPTFDIGAVEDWGSGRLLFTLEEHSFGEKNYQGVYELDMRTGMLSEIAIPGITLLDISPDHMGLLAARDSELIIINLHYGSEKVLANNYYHLSPSGAKWDHSSNLIYYLAADESGTYLLQMDPETEATDRLTVDSPIAVLEAAQDTVILGRGTCNPFGNCVTTDLSWITDQDIEVASVTVGESILLPCQSPTDFVYTEKDENGSLTLHIRPHNQDPEIVFWATWPEYADCDWSPNGNRLAVIPINRFWYSGSIQEYYFQILLPNTNQIRDLTYLKAPLDQVTWSPDGQYVVFTGTEVNEDAYQLEVNLFELNSFTVARFNQFTQFKSENYLTIPKVFWVP